MPMSSGSPARSESRALRITRSNSIDLDIRGPDDRPPFGDLGLVEGPERLRGEQVGRRNILTKIGETLAHIRIGHGLERCGAELADDVLRRALRHPHAIP